MSRPATLPDVRIRPYSPADEPAVLALLNAALGSGPTGGWTQQFFRWKHLRNPFGPSFILVAELEGRLVGLRPFMRWRFRSRDRTLSAVRAVDTATHPDFQGMGIFSRLTREAVDACRHEVDLVFNTPNAMSGPGYLKLGWKAAGNLPVWVRVRRPVRFVQGIGALGGNATPGGTSPAVEAATAADVLADGPAISSLLERIPVDERFSTARDVGYLWWRYASPPNLDYRAVLLQEGRRTEGLAIFRIRSRGTLWETTVAELIVSPEDATSARRLLRRVVRASGVDHVTCHLSRVAGWGVRRLGFVPAPGGVRLVVNPLRPRIAPDPTDLRSWSFSLGDVEVF